MINLMTKQEFVELKKNEINSFLLDKVELENNFTHPYKDLSVEDIQAIHNSFLEQDIQIFIKFMEDLSYSLENEEIIHYSIQDVNYGDESDLEIRSYLMIGKLHGQEIRKSVIFDTLTFPADFDEMLTMLSEVEYDIQCFGLEDDSLLEYSESIYLLGKKNTGDRLAF